MNGQFALEEIVSKRLVVARFLRGRSRGNFPLELRWQTLARPTRERIGFKQAHMTDGPIRIDRRESSKCELHPFAVLLDPVKRCVPIFLLNRVPTK